MITSSTAPSMYSLYLTFKYSNNLAGREQICSPQPKKLKDNMVILIDDVVLSIKELAKHIKALKVNKKHKVLMKYNQQVLSF